MRCVGLTGGAGTGKTVVADIWRSLHVPLLCADDIVRKETGMPGKTLNTIRQTFGDSFFTADKCLKRKKMRDEIIRNKDSREKLEAVLHPLVRRTITQWLRWQRTPYAVIVVPLLIESGMDDLADIIVVIDCPRKLQIQRVATRDRCSHESAGRLIDLQLPAQERISHADIVLHNNSTIEHLRQQIISLHSKLNKGVL